MIKEYEDEFYAKNDENELRKYIKRILQRFFEIENVNSQLSKESMIVEAIRRYKEYCKTKCSNYVIGINDLTGLVYLSASILGGELKFSKNSAFNKDFGNTADTICEGNDPRLSDARIPLEHQHLIQEVEGLEEALSKLGFITSGDAHGHTNLSVLDKIRYTGTRNRIDLKYLEQFVRSVRALIENLVTIADEVERLCGIKKDVLSVILTSIMERINTTNEAYIDNLMSVWVDTANKYAKDKTIEWYWENKDKLHTVFFLKSDVEPLQKNLEEGIKFICDGEIPITIGAASTFVDETTGYSKETNTQVIEIPEPAKSKLLSSGGVLIDKYVVTYFRWEDTSGKTHEQRMPYKYMFTKHTELGVSCGWNSANEFIIQYSVTTHFPNRKYIGSNFYIVEDLKLENHEIREELEGYSSRLWKANSKSDLEAMEGYVDYNTFYIIDGIYTDNKEDEIYDWDNNKYLNLKSMLPPIIDFFETNIGKRLTFKVFDSSDTSMIFDGETVSCMPSNHNEKYPWVAVYNPPKFTDVFKNPRIYFQVYNAEGHPEDTVTTVLSGGIYDGVTGELITS